MSKIYIAARYGRRILDLKNLAKRLEQQGHEITSKWLLGGEEDRSIEQAAQMDVDDVSASDILIFVGESPASRNQGGGRWFEFGMAYALGKRCIAILHFEKTPVKREHLPEGHESVFTALPDVEVVRSENELLDLLNSSTSVAQVGGSHYNANFQHWDWASQTGLPYLESCATKYLSRWRSKGGIEDLRKAQSYLRKSMALADSRDNTDTFAGNRPGLSKELRERFIASAQVPWFEATIIYCVDTATNKRDIKAAEKFIEVLIQTNAPVDGTDSPFGYQGDES